MAAGIVTIITGSTRCGSSLVMRLLDHAGLPPLCDAESRGSSYELDAVNGSLQGDWSFLDRATGRAVKVPELGGPSDSIPHGRRYRFIVLSRDERQQALSQIKFLRWASGFNVSVTRSSVESLAASIRRDAPVILGRAHRTGGAVLPLRFERLLADSEEAIRELLAFCSLDTGKASDLAALVRSRSPDCYPGMLEEELWTAGELGPRAAAREGQGAREGE